MIEILSIVILVISVILFIVTILKFKPIEQSSDAIKTDMGEKAYEISEKKDLVPESVNYHFTRQCNYSCGFCFHTSKTSYMLEIEDAKKGLRLLKEAGMKKINFAGGEPFLYPKFLGQLVSFCKEELKVESVSIVTNGSKLTESWFKQYGHLVDVLAVSVDSFIEDINVKIGRGKGKHLECVQKARDYCEKYNITFKINSVINRYNYQEDMNKEIIDLNPKRWKVFQVLILEGENNGGDSIRDATKMIITKEEYDQFLERHKDLKCLVPENNDVMKNSYLVLDEYMRFLDSSQGKKEPSDSILEVGVAKAMEKSGFSRPLFLERGGVYDWTRSESCNNKCTNTQIYDW